MATAGTSEDAPDRLAARLADADFVRLVATADGDALAATGLLARALDSVATPYQASLAAVPDVPATDADCTVAVGLDAGVAGAFDVALSDEPLAVTAADVVRELEAESVDAMLALAGAACAGAAPSGQLLESADVERRPGVGVPTPDPIAGLAGSTLVHASFSGDESAVETALTAAGVDVDADGRALASTVAIAAVREAPPRAAKSVERALHPYESDRFETLGGFADVLDVVARERPGTGLALALGHDVEAAALETWRDHGRRVHEALRSADVERYGGLVAVRLDAWPRERAAATLGTVARLCFAYRSPEPAAVVTTDGAAAVAADEFVADPLRTAAASLDGRSCARGRRGAATFDGSTEAFVDAYREAR